MTGVVLPRPAEAPLWRKAAPAQAIGAPRKDGDWLVLETDQGAMRFALTATGARLCLGPPVRDYAILSNEPRPVPAEIRLRPDGAEFVYGGLSLHVETSPVSFRLERHGRIVLRSAMDGHFVRERRIAPFARTGRGWLAAFELEGSAPVYGLGEKWGRLDRRGQFIASYNEDALGVNAERSYKNAPFAWGPAADGRPAWGLFAHTGAAVSHAVGYAPWSHRAYVLETEEEGCDLFLFAGAEGAEILNAYAELTGRSPMPPLWSLGVILSKAYYRDADEILNAAGEVRRRGMPCDVITFDGRAWQDTDTRFAFEWCPRRYADPAPTLRGLKELGFRICVWEYPLISERNPLFAELARKGWLLRDTRDGEPYRFAFDLEPFGEVLTPLPVSGLIDFTHPDAYAFWRDQHKALFEAGVDMIKADFGEQVEEHCAASNGAQGRALHNVYALLYNRCVYEAATLYAGAGAFLFTRSTWASGQRYPSQWGGDPQADWQGLAASLRGGLSWGLSGAPFYATDIGGFYGDRRDPELYVRWLQAGVFSAHFRLHGIGAREPWSYGPEAEEAAMAGLRLRYRLLPYLDAQMRLSCETGLPLQRAMALAFPEDRAAWAFDDQFMCGRDLLVAPVLQPGGEVCVYLPAGRWRRFADNRAFEGGCVHTLRLDLNEMAVFAREGAEIPLGPDVQTTDELGGAAKIERWWRAGSSGSAA
jgi:alpha-D-xyloside xylohydrolase